MNIADVVIDMETCSTSANAAVMQLAACVFNRNAEGNDDVFPTDIPTFSACVDLRSCVMDGFDFDMSTVKWWSERPADVKAEVAGGDCYPLRTVFENFIEWLNDVKQLLHAEVITLWAQGSDFDIAITRNVCRKYDLKLPLPFHNFRDARTFIIEIGSYFLLPDYIEGINDNRRVYAHMGQMPGDTADAHNAVYDAQRTAWNLWVIFYILRDALKDYRAHDAKTAQEAKDSL